MNYLFVISLSKIKERKLLKDLQYKNYETFKIHNESKEQVEEKKSESKSIGTLRM